MSKYRVYAALVAILVVAGCQTDHIRTLRDAEETFSRAAEQENRARLAVADPQRMPAGERETGSTAIAAKVSDTTGYRLSAQMTEKLIKEKRSELQADGLLCTAYVIRAFSLWRLGEYANASGLAGDAKCDNAAPRDRALLQIVPALVRIDESNARAFNGTRSADEQKETSKELEVALGDLGAADKSMPRDHPLRAYIFAARLAALRVAQVSPNREGITGPDESTVRAKAAADADDVLVQYRYYLGCDLHLPGDPEHPTVPYWRQLFGNGPKSAKPPTCLN